MGAKHGKKKSRFPPFSILLIGNSMAGKTALIKSYEYLIKTNKDYDEKNTQLLDLDYKSIMVTIANDFIIVDHTIKGEQNEDINIKVKIWDSPGNERFSDLVLSAAKNTQGIILAYDITNLFTFRDLNKWIEKIRECHDISEFPIIIVGCKLDLEDKRQVSSEEGQKFAEEYKFPFFETSAQTGKGVKEAFSTLIQKVYDRNKNKK